MFFSTLLSFSTLLVLMGLFPCPRVGKRGDSGGETGQTHIIAAVASAAIHSPTPPALFNLQPTIPLSASIKEPSSKQY
jgi:hypothetical protein